MMDLVHDRAIIVAEEDRISSLPDEIIHRILSFVEIKDAIQTSKFSRRWRHIWTSIPHLNIDTSEFRHLPQFAKFMKHALSRRNNSASLSSVNLTFTGAATQFAVKSIIKYAFSHNVKQLTMGWYAQKSLEFPQCLFSSHTLKILTLNVCNMKRCSVPGSGWDLPSLETLNLTNINFTGGTDKSLNPFSKCVNLKNLTLDRFHMYNVGTFIIYAPQLSNLTITNAFGFPKVFNVVAPQLQNLTASLNDRQQSMLQLLTEGFDSLEKVELSLFSSPYRKNYVPLASLLDMFHKFRSATVLVLDQHIIEAISSCLDEFSHEPCPFNNLKCLKVQGVPRYPTRAKNYLLENSPSATFIMDSPQVPQKRSRDPVPDDGVANKVAKLVAEIKQAETTKLPTQDDVIAELRAKIQILETTNWEYEKLMPHIIKGKMAELKLQVESGNPDDEIIQVLHEPCQIKNYLENSPSATFIMDSPQVPQKRSTEPVPNDGMANKVAKLEAENKQEETTGNKKRTLKAKLPTQGDVIAELRAKIKILETTQFGYYELMQHVIKGKMAELKPQVESGNPDYEVIRSMGCEIISLIDSIPECSRVAMKANFSTWYNEVKRQTRTYINARQWAKIETQLGYLTESERVHYNNIQIRTDVLSTIFR